MNSNVRLRHALKVVFCLAILVTIVRLQFSGDIKLFENYKEYSSKMIISERLMQ